MTHVSFRQLAWWAAVALIPVRPVFAALRLIRRGCCRCCWPSRHVTPSRAPLAHPDNAATPPSSWTPISEVCLPGCDSRRFPPHQQVMTLYLPSRPGEAGQAGHVPTSPPSRQPAAVEAGLAAGHTLTRRAMLGCAAPTHGLALAEHIGRSRPVHGQMTLKARELGMTQTRYVMPTLPTPPMTSAAMAVSGPGRHAGFPQYYRYFGLHDGPTTARLPQYQRLLRAARLRRMRTATPTPRVTSAASAVRDGRRMITIFLGVAHSEPNAHVDA